MKVILIGVLTFILSSCGSSDSETKLYFEGTVMSYLNIPGKDKIKSVTVELNTGETVSIFLEQSYKITAGEKVKIFKYEDSVVHYLQR